MPKRSSKRKDLNESAKSVVDRATADPQAAESDIVTQAAKMLGRLGGKKGGPARAIRLSVEQRSAIAKKAATTRWESRG